MFYRGGDGGGHMFAGLLVVIVLVVAVALLVVWLSRTRHGNAPLHATGAPAFGPPQPSPREILDRRLASGELTAEQYDVIRAKLDGG